jgi:subtilisin-like proprotein convertase family protein
MLSSWASAQCTYSTSTPIPDDDTLVIQFSVSGLVNNNLSSPTQGICGVDIRFRHEYLGDLTVTLISPAGTMVQLIGPTTTASAITNLSVWNVGFVPCGDTPMPDAGIAAVWSNLEPWSSFTPYSGTYHPSSGCLENFNTGPANGLWQIVIEDHDQFQLGILEEVTLIFCDSTGLQCQECAPNAGVLTPASYNICSGENIQSSDIMVDFGGNPPAAGLYSYTYILVQGNSILQSGPNFSFTPPAGNYSICGMSYLSTDAAILDALISAGDYATLAQAIDNGAACADLTNVCVSVMVTDRPDTMVVSGNLCAGEVFSFGGQNYSADGIFYQVHDGPGLCDTVFEIRISPRILNVNIPTTDTLTCSLGTVQATANVSGANGPFTYSWTAVTGNISSSPMLQTISVDQAGQYLVEVTDGICDGSSGVLVVADQGYPQVFFEGGTLSCNVPSIDINPIFIPSDANVLWTFPNGFTTTQPDITVTEPGPYLLSVTNANGCTTSRTVDISIDTMTHPVSIYEISKDCVSGQVTLATTNSQFQTSFNWTGPNMFTSTYWRPIVSDAGLYSIIVSHANGCLRTADYLFTPDYAIPDLQVSPPDTLNCNEIITLSANSSVPGVTYVWSGPFGFGSNLQNININQPGTYYAQVTAPNNCVNSLQVEVAEGDDIFDFLVFTDTITCTTTQITIGVVAPDADEFDWLNYSGPGDDQPMIDVTSGGNYQVLMTDTQTGCEVLAEVFAYTDLVQPSFEYTRDTITCLEPFAEMTFIPFPGYTYANVYWELPDLTIVPGPTILSNLPGEHRLYGIGTNGCVGVWRVNIPFDTIPPFVILETDTLICLDTVDIISQTLDSITSYQWSGPGIINNQNTFIEVDEAGWYHLEAYGMNGCPAELDILVDSNYVLPAFSIDADSLRCDRPATLTIIPTDPLISYVWIDPNGVWIDNALSVDVNQPGTYTCEVQGENQCTAADSVTLAPLAYPLIVISADTLTCRDLTVPISIQTEPGQYTTAWVDLNGDTISTSATTIVSQAGPFIASVSGQNACETRDTLLVAYDTLSPLAGFIVDGVIKCQNREVELDAMPSTPDPLTFSWSTINGAILSDPTVERVVVRDTGLYVLIVQNPTNGCSDTSMQVLSEDPTAIVDAVLDVHQAECSGDMNASIVITGIQGGIAPITYQLNGGIPQSSPSFTGLDAGAFIVAIMDADQCVFDTTVIIEPTFPFTIDAGPDQEIYIGESTMLEGSTDLMPTDVLSDRWDSLDILLCSNCPLFEVSPLETTTYTYQLTSSTGCTLEDHVTVFVLDRAKYYIANVFSPNGDGINDEVRVNPTPGLQRVLKWVIFDRWGDAVYGRTDFDPLDTSVFWDGRTTTGDFANPGVFPYIIEVQLISGKVQIFNGDITLIR